MAERLRSWIANKAFMTRPDGMVLFMQDAGTAKDHEAAQGRWDVPGGRMDEGEVDMQAALARELEEETGYQVPEGSLPVLVGANMYQHGTGPVNCLHYYLVPVPAEFEPVLSDEHQAYVWLSVEEASEKDLFSSARRGLEQLQEYYGRTTA